MEKTRASDRAKAKMYTISETAEKCGISAFTLRFYDKQGLFPGIFRAKGGRRLFSESDLDSIALIACLKNTGMSIKDIRKYINSKGKDQNSTKVRREIIQRQKLLIQAKLEEFHRYMQIIDYKLWYFDEVEKRGEDAVREEAAARRRQLPKFFPDEPSK